jgi:surfactin synthase thioesterase subunit
MTTAPGLFCLPGAGGDPNFWRPLGDRLPNAQLCVVDGRG